MFYKYGMGFIINPYIYGGGGSYLVDDYSPLVAFSVRKISSTATNCLRVRRTSDNAEQDIGFSGNDLDVASLESFCSATDGYVVKWYDQSGNNKDAVNATSTQQPKIVSSGTALTDASGNNGLYFDGATNWFLPITGSITSTQLFYASFVYERASSGITSMPLGNTKYVFWWVSTNVIYSGLTNAVVHDSGQTGSGVFLTTCLRDSSDNYKYWNNNSAGTTKTSVNTPTAFGAIGYNAGTRHNGILSEVIYWNDDQESNRTAIQDEINAYYSIY